MYGQPHQDRKARRKARSLAKKVLGSMRMGVACAMWLLGSPGFKVQSFGAAAPGQEGALVGEEGLGLDAHGRGVRHVASRVQGSKFTVLGKPHQDRKVRSLAKKVLGSMRTGVVCAMWLLGSRVQSSEFWGSRTRTGRCARWRRRSWARGAWAWCAPCGF